MNWRRASQIEREAERLEEEIAQAEDEGDHESARLLRRDLQELAREAAEQERWEEEGRERGWM